jgi:hypothetical protein
MRARQNDFFKYWTSGIRFPAEFLGILLSSPACKVKVKVKHSRDRPCRPREFQEVKVPRFLDKDTVWW